MRLVAVYLIDVAALKRAARMEALPNRHFWR
jgi:hypothetical protein